MVMEVVEVSYLQHQVGAVSFDTTTGIGAFEYNARFIQQGIELSYGQIWCTELSDVSRWCFLHLYAILEFHVVNHEGKQRKSVKAIPALLRCF